MSVSKSWVAVEANRKAVSTAYRSFDLLTIEGIASKLGTTFQNVQAALRAEFSPEEIRALARLRYSASKTGAKNPMLGKMGKKHHRWKGECEDQKGYLTILFRGKRQFVHHVVMAKKLGLKRIPKGWAVHHINSDTRDNHEDNLALVTLRGHREIHYRQLTTAALQLKQSSLSEALKLMTSP